MNNEGAHVPRGQPKIAMQEEKDDKDDGREDVSRLEELVVAVSTLSASLYLQCSEERSTESKAGT